MQKKYTPLIDVVKKMKGSDTLFKEAMDFNGIRIPDFVVELFAAFFCEEGYSVEIIPRSVHDFPGIQAILLAG